MEHKFSSFAMAGLHPEIRSSELTENKKVVICPEVDELIAQCPDCHYDLPKALLPDTDDSEVRRFGPTMARVAGMESQKTPVDKDKKFGNIVNDSCS